ncbi:hypothetical protein [Desulfonatronum sp. SC1]|uniref:hypothetical protein n=1 Tax=Desulfonatronum sp. SC1 TaxID=2109626 RepID=UPI0011B1F330|nr:hypothetical protein [Desulfonatronum sp. SC1]
MTGPPAQSADYSEQKEGLTWQTTVFQGIIGDSSTHPQRHGAEKQACSVAASGVDAVIKKAQWPDDGKSNGRQSGPGAADVTGPEVNHWQDPKGNKGCSQGRSKPVNGEDLHEQSAEERLKASHVRLAIEKDRKSSPFGNVLGHQRNDSGIQIQIQAKRPGSVNPNRGPKNEEQNEDLAFGCSKK